MSTNNTIDADRAAGRQGTDGETPPREGNGQDQPPRLKKGRRAPVIVGAVILLLLLGVGAIFGTRWFLDSIRYVSTDDAAIDGDHANVSARMLGRIAGVAVVEGNEVQAGQLLVQLDDTDLRAQETQGLSSLNYARANLTLARVNLDKTREDFARTEALFKGGAATREQYDHAGSSLETANAQYSIAQAQVDTANAQLGVIEAQLLNTRITAPISGTVSKKPLMPGELVQPGQAILAINDLKHVWVRANLEETKIGRIERNAAVKITVDAYRSYPLTGRVSRIAAAIVPPPFSIGEFTKTTQRIPVEIEFDNLPEGVVLLPGMSAEVKIETAAAARPSWLPRL